MRILLTVFVVIGVHMALIFSLSIMNSESSDKSNNLPETQGWGSNNLPETQGGGSNNLPETQGWGSNNLPETQVGEGNNLPEFQGGGR